VLDALVAEARLRWGFDPAVGLQVIASEGLTASPLEPSRPVLIVPLATLRATLGDRWLGFELSGPYVGRWEVAAGKEYRRFHGHKPGEVVAGLDIGADGRSQHPGRRLRRRCIAGAGCWTGQ
jgi:hypothetical protein